MFGEWLRLLDDGGLAMLPYQCLPRLCGEGGGMRVTMRRAWLAGALVVVTGAMGDGAAAGQMSAAPAVNRHLYSETADAAADIRAAQVVARRERKRILIEFGGNWCGDCLVLDGYYHQSPNAELITKYYVLLHVDIGHMDHNMEIAEKYHVPVRRGVPALVVLDARGAVLYSEREKEFEHASPEAVTALLERWKA